MEFRNGSFERREVGASQTLNVLIAYENLAAGQRAMRLCWNLACQQEGDLSLHPRLWRLDLVADPVYAGFAIADAVQAELFIVSISSQAELSKPARHWLKLCLAIARKQATSAAMVALLGTDDQINESYSPNFQFLRSVAQEAGLEFFIPFAGRKAALDNVGCKAEAVEVAGGLETGALAARQLPPAYQPAILRA